MESSLAIVYTKDGNCPGGKTRALLDDDYLGSETIPENLKNLFSIKHDSIITQQSDH